MAGECTYQYTACLARRLFLNNFIKFNTALIEQAVDQFEQSMFYQRRYIGMNYCLWFYETVLQQLIAAVLNFKEIETIKNRTDYNNNKKVSS